MGHAQAMGTAFTWIDGDLPEQHRQFHTTRLPFIPVTTLDERGRPWGSILYGREKQFGWVSSPNESTLVFDAQVPVGDPLLHNSSHHMNSGEKMLAAGIGIEFSTRRRNKFAGRIDNISVNGPDVKMAMTVNQAIGYVILYLIPTSMLTIHVGIVPSISMSENYYLNHQGKHRELCINKPHWENLNNFPKTW
jgi:hypothetical protein